MGSWGENLYSPLKVKPFIGGTLDIFRLAYGNEVRVSTYRPDLYATSYDFECEEARLTATVLPDRVSELSVFFPRQPSDSDAELLEKYTGLPGWTKASNENSAFERHFPAFDPKRGKLHLTDGCVALVQHKVGLGELVFWIQADEYPELLAAYREGQSLA
jgi:hypothetical protein